MNTFSSPSSIYFSKFHNLHFTYSVTQKNFKNLKNKYRMHFCRLLYYYNLKHFKKYDYCFGNTLWEVLSDLSTQTVIHFAKLALRSWRAVVWLFLFKQPFYFCGLNILSKQRVNLGFLSSMQAVRQHVWATRTRIRLFLELWNEHAQNKF